ncbi:GNAT family N-acetyltransferase [Pseudarthrobacter sp. NamE2]|uniref:GNAT family N-acetyltransferase n=1 Tax=Pseudarthrobacter sp. NamE2 TaxID=2576838 RepID=UPI0010FE59A9|nr:GNAT family N-acetyltransferase [Pseudarthrobacter sp. NamE2]TLM82695.1 GNAT family N-acetyltransferase [Pseudarthrobacter sp. NamE2]
MLGTGKIEISDEVIVLRPLNMGDAGDHLAGEDADLVRWLNGGPGTKESVLRHIERVEKMWQDGGPVFTFAVRLLAEDILIGTIDVQLCQDAYRPDQANIAYGLYPAWRGHGFATRAVRLALKFLRPEASVHSALIRADPANVSSAAVALRAGFRLVEPAAKTRDGHDWYEFVLR